MLRSLFIFVVVLTLCTVASPPKAEARGCVIRAVGKVLGVQRRQERRAEGRGLFHRCRR